MLCTNCLDQGNSFTQSQNELWNVTLVFFFVFYEALFEDFIAENYDSNLHFIRGKWRCVVCQELSIFLPVLKAWPIVNLQIPLYHRRNNETLNSNFHLGTRCYDGHRPILRDERGEGDFLSLLKSSPINIAFWSLPPRLTSLWRSTPIHGASSAVSHMYII